MSADATAVTVVGGRGYIGRHLVARLNRTGQHWWVPQRDDPALFERDLGTVFYCAGLTADFRSRPFDTVQAHVGLLREILERARFDQLIYLSSTRVYLGATDTHEDQPLVVRSQDADDVYKLSKLMGESLALHCGRNCKVARLSNVVGGVGGNPDSFVYSLLRDAQRGNVVLRSHPESAKDYIHVDDVVDVLLRVAGSTLHRVYNVASAVQIRHKQWLDLLVARTGCTWSVQPDAPLQSQLPIENQRAALEFFMPKPRTVLNSFNDLEY